VSGAGYAALLCVLPLTRGLAQGVTRLAQADSIYQLGDRAASARAYAAVLRLDPQSSRATFRLAQLTRDPAQALRLYRRYLELQPRDAWGYVALGDLLAREGKRAEALREYDIAAQLAPGERDVTVGRARVLARTGAPQRAAEAYAGWLADHPGDAEAWQELGKVELRIGKPAAAARALQHAQALAPDPTTSIRLREARAQAAPSLEPTGGGSHDSDGNRVTRFGLSGDLAVADAIRVGVQAGHERISASSVSPASLNELSARLALRPRAALRIDGSLGVLRLEPTGFGSSPLTTPGGRLRLRLRNSAGSAALEAGVQRAALDASPVLLAQHALRTEVGGLLTLPLGPLRIRGDGRVAQLETIGETNHRTRLGAALALPLSYRFELSGQYHRMSFAHQTSAGYFAPRLAETLEAGSYVELGDGAPFTLALDLGAGAQRLAQHGAQMGPWQRALRLYGYLTARIAPATQLQLEVEAYDAAVAPDAVSTSASGWRYASAMLSLRLAIP
jgi:tetratricopeptide (TPR) repeat protein